MTRTRLVASELLDVIVLAMRTVRREMRRARPPIETSQWVLLRKIAEGASTVSDLARHSGTSLPTMSKSVDMLVRRGWVARGPHASDRRQTLVELTLQGRRVIRDYRARFEMALAAELSELSQAERDQAMAGLTRLAAALGRKSS